MARSLGVGGSVSFDGRVAVRRLESDRGESRRPRLALNGGVDSTWHAALVRHRRRFGSFLPARRARMLRGDARDVTARHAGLSQMRRLQLVHPVRDQARAVETDERLVGRGCAAGRFGRLPWRAEPQKLRGAPLPGAPVDELAGWLGMCAVVSLYGRLTRWQNPPAHGEPWRPRFAKIAGIGSAMHLALSRHSRCHGGIVPPRSARKARAGTTIGGAGHAGVEQVRRLQRVHFA
mmetsp:Transcript_53374/g.155288  ORF Transcript_53374/g.155288 Transcript_53374/m.155288 type:complete len:234 (-) Transcript_53374:165-866(-)